MNKPKHEILSEVVISPKELSGFRATIIGIKQDPTDSELWVYQVEIHTNKKWVHQDFVKKLGEMKTGLDDGVPIIGAK